MKKPTNKEKKDYIEKVLKEIKRVADVTIDEGRDETADLKHPLELIAYVMEAYMVKVIQTQMQTTNLFPTTNEKPSIVQPESKDNVIEFSKKKTTTFH